MLCASTDGVLRLLGLDACPSHRQRSIPLHATPTKTAICHTPRCIALLCNAVPAEVPLSNPLRPHETAAGMIADQMDGEDERCATDCSAHAFWAAPPCTVDPLRAMETVPAETLAGHSFLRWPCLTTVALLIGCREGGQCACHSMPCQAAEAFACSFLCCSVRRDAASAVIAMTTSRREQVEAAALPEAPKVFHAEDAFERLSHAAMEGDPDHPRNVRHDDIRCRQMPPIKRVTPPAT